MRRFQEAIVEARRAGTAGTRWVVSSLVEAVYVSEEKRELKGGPEMFGLPISFSANMPVNQVALMSNGITASQFIVPIIIDLDHA